MKHYNPTIAEDSTKILNLKGDSLQDVQEYIQPVISIKRHTHIYRATAAIVGNTTTTAYTTPVGSDFYLVGLDLNYYCDAASDCAAAYVDFYTDGVIRYLNLPIIALTALVLQKQVYFNPPIKIDRNTAIRIVGSKTVGVFSKQLSIWGFVVESSRGV